MNDLLQNSLFSAWDSFDSHTIYSVGKALRLYKVCTGSGCFVEQTSKNNDDRALRLMVKSRNLRMRNLWKAPLRKLMVEWVLESWVSLSPEVI